MTINSIFSFQVISFVFIFLLHSYGALSTFYNIDMVLYLFASSFGLIVKSIWEEPVFTSLKRKSVVFTSIYFVVVLFLQYLIRAKFNPRSCQSWLLFIIHSSLLIFLETHCHKCWTDTHMNFSTVIIKVLLYFLWGFWHFSTFFHYFTSLFFLYLTISFLL